MRYYQLVLVFMVFLISSCFKANSDPYPPTYPEPRDGATDVSVSILLTWYCEDPDGDELLYDVYFGKDPTPTLMASEIEENSYNPEILEYNTTYHWKVVAKDSKGGTSESPVWSFKTTEKPNSPPVWDSVPDQEVNEGSELELDLLNYVNDPDGDEIRVSLVDGPEGVVVEEGVLRWTPDYDASGSHRIEVVATDIHDARATTDFLVIVKDVNRPPEEPTVVYPSDGSIDVPTSTKLRWNCSDPDGDDLLYDVYFGKDPTPTLVASGLSENLYDPKSLEYNTIYYWKIAARDSKGETSESPVWSFKTINRRTKTYAIVAHMDGVSIIDVSDSHSPRRISYLDLDNRTYDVQVNGDYAYAAEYDGIAVIDIFDPNFPRLLHKIDIPNAQVMSIRVIDDRDLAFVSAGSKGVIVLDISRPLSPAEISTFDTNGITQDVDIKDSYVFIADHFNGLVVADISDPNNPSKIGHLTLNSMAYGVRVSGNYAFIADYAQGLVIVDISDPYNPTLVTNVPMNGLAMKVYLSGDLAFVSCSEGGVKIVDVSDPENPEELSEFDTDGKASGVSVKGDKVFVADYQNGLVVLDVSNPNLPVQIGHFDTQGTVLEVKHLSQLLALADGEDGFKISSLYDGEIYDSYNIGYTLSVYVDAYHRAFLAKGYGGIVITLVNNTSICPPKSVLDTAGYANSAISYGNNLFVSDGSNGVVIFDISDIDSPVEINHVDTAGDTKSIYILENYAYVADGNNGVLIWDISDPSNPNAIGRINTSNALSIFVKDNYAYIADYANGLVVADVSDKSNPRVISQINLRGFAVDVEVNYNDVGIIALLGYGFVLLDLSDPTSPTELTRVETDGYMRNIDLRFDTVLVAGDYGGLSAYDISDPNSPSMIFNTIWGPYNSLDIFER